MISKIALSNLRWQSLRVNVTTVNPDNPSDIYTPATIVFNSFASHGKFRLFKRLDSVTDESETHLRILLNFKRVISTNFD